MSYKNYLKSQHWMDVKDKYWKSNYAKRCTACFKGNVTIQLHHKSYQDLGKERLQDLVPLCPECHTLVHDHMKLNPQLTLKEATKEISKWLKTVNTYEIRQNWWNRGKKAPVARYYKKKIKYSIYQLEKPTGVEKSGVGAQKSQTTSRRGE